MKYKNTRFVTIQNFRMFLASQNTILIFKVTKFPWASLNVYDHPYYYNTQIKQCALHVRPIRPLKAPSSLTFIVTLANVCFHQPLSIGSSRVIAQNQNPSLQQADTLLHSPKAPLPRVCYKCQVLLKSGEFIHCLNKYFWSFGNFPANKRDGTSA